MGKKKSKSTVDQAREYEAMAEEFVNRITRAQKFDENRFGERRRLGTLLTVYPEEKASLIFLLSFYRSIANTSVTVRKEGT